MLGSPETCAALAFAAPASAQQPIVGFTDSHAEQQAYEGQYRNGVRADVIGRTSRALSVRPQLVGTAGYAVQFLPGMRDAIDQGDEKTARTYRDLLIDSLRDAARLAKRAT